MYPVPEVVGEERVVLNDGRTGGDGGSRPERRKLQRVGRSTLSVSLPKAWSDRRGLAPGDEVLLVQEDDGSLRLVPGSTSGPGPIEVSIPCGEDRTCPFVGQMLSCAYMLGMDTMTIRCPSGVSTEVRGQVYQMMPGHPGLTLISEDPSRMVFTSVVDTGKQRCSALKRRLHIIIDSMFQALLDREEYPAEQRVKETEMIHALVTRQCLRALKDRAFASSVGIGHDVEVVTNVAFSLAMVRISRRLHRLMLIRDTVGLPPGAVDVLREVSSLLASLMEMGLSPKARFSCEQCHEVAGLTVRVRELLMSSVSSGEDDAHSHHAHSAFLSLNGIIEFVTHLLYLVLLGRVARMGVSRRPPGSHPAGTQSLTGERC